MLLWLQGLIFTVLVPGVVAFYVPQTLRNGHAANAGWWSLGWILFAVGAVSRRTERPEIKVQELIPIAEAPARLTSAVKLTVQRTALNSQVVDDIKALCQRHRGDCAVLVEIVAPDQKRVLIKAGRELAVQPTEAFIAEVGRLIGEGHAQLVPRKPQAQSNGNGRGRWNRGENG